MAKEKVSPNSIPNFEADWGKDTSYKNLPYSGQAVQDFVKTNLKVAKEQRAGAAYYDSITSVLYFFQNDDDKSIWLETGSDPTSELIIASTPFTFASTIYQFRITNNMGSNNVYFTTHQEKCMMSVGFTSQEKGITDTEWVDTDEDAYFSISVDKGSTGTFIEILKDRQVLHGENLEFDIHDYITVGANRVRFSARGATTEQTFNLTFNVTLTSMYLQASNFTWNIPFIQGQVYQLGGMNIGGAINKMLYVKVTKDELYQRTYSKNLGTQTYTTNAYYFNELEFPNTGTGVYNVELWLNAEGLESEHLIYNIMCISAEEANTADLVCINEAPSSVLNYSGNTLFKYAIYNHGIATGNPEITVVSIIRNSPTILINETLTNISTEQIYSYYCSLEIESEEVDMSLSASMVLGNTQTAVYTIDNSASYPPTANSVFYLNAANRSNSQENKLIIINEATGGTINATWNNMSMSGTTDGWVTDNNNRKCLLIPARSSVNVEYQPLSSVDAAKTIEFNFMVKNIADYNEPIITIMNDRTSDSFRGICIKPTEIIVHSRDLNNPSRNTEQSYTFGEDELINVVFTFTKNYKVNYGNLATIYVNGVKKCEFAYENTDSWETNANIILGSNTADLYLYNCRIYNMAFGFQNAFQNYVASLPTTTEKAAAYALGTAILNDSWGIDFDAVSRVANVMVVQITDEGGKLPTYGMSKSYTTHSTLELHYHDHPEWSFKIQDIETSGQGTTSMNYWRWNLRFRIDKSSGKKCNISYWNKELDEWSSPELLGSVKFDGDNHTQIKRITAKKNYASSMQSHKMGTTGAYNDLQQLVVGGNEAGGRTAVFQYPVYAFERQEIEGTIGQYVYNFIGLYTIGPDKGDKPTFAYDSKDYSNTLITLEGVDHDKKLATFRYPWNEEVVYKASEESLCIDKNDTTYDKGWEVSNCQGLGTDSEDDEKEIATILIKSFKPAYDIAYKNSQLILGVNETLEDINENVDIWQMNIDPETNRSYQYFEFWTDGIYDLYYLDIQTGKYKFANLNLLSQYVSYGGEESDLEGKTIQEKNELFKAKRRENFRANMSKYWNLRDTLFCYTFLLIFGATDNFAKNSYPYNFGGETGKWRWRQDDLDTIFDIDNQGHSTKNYNIEYNDWTTEEKTAYVFRGEDSTFWTLVGACFENEIKAIGKEILAGMVSLSDSGTSTMERLLGFFNKYYWNKAQKYFRKTAYNIDAEYSYEEAWPQYNSGVYQVDVSPLAQSLGDHYEAEKLWVERRLIYVMSKFQYGPFYSYDDKCLGQITFRPQLAQTFTLTPAIDMYPDILVGASSLVGINERIKTGNSAVISGVGGGNTNIYITATDYMQSIGDLSQIAVDNDNASITIAGKRLQNIKVGDQDPSIVTSNLATLIVGECPSVLYIDARNLHSLTGTVDLTQCPRLLQAFFGGTDVRSLKIMDGAKLTDLQLPDSITTIDLTNIASLDKNKFSYNTIEKVQYVRIENCTHIPTLETLWNIYKGENQELRYIRLIGFAENGDDTTVSMLANIAGNKDKDGNPHVYHGIDANGDQNNLIRPVIQGSLVVPYAYPEDQELVERTFTGLILTVNNYYVKYLDTEVQKILVENFSTNKKGMTTADESRIRNFEDAFQNSSIINFLDMYRILNVTFPDLNEEIESPFLNCVNLSSVKFPALITTIGTYSFVNCSSLSTLDFSLCKSRIIKISKDAFKGCNSLDLNLDLSTWNSLNYIDARNLIGDNGELTCMDNNTITTLII